MIWSVLFCTKNALKQQGTVSYPSKFFVVLLVQSLLWATAVCPYINEQQWNMKQLFC